MIVLIDCGHPPTLTNGSYQVTEGESDTVFVHKTLVTYSCDPGYELTPAANTLMCQQDGTWLGEVGNCYSGETDLF